MDPLTIAQVATIMGVDRTTVLRMIHTKRLPATKLAGRTGSWIIDRDDLEPLLAGRPSSIGAR